MKCPWCQAVLDEDSWFCDQCGKELLMCLRCGELRKGKVCTQNGTHLVPVRERTGFAVLGSAPSGVFQQDSAPTPQNLVNIDELVLINNNLGLNLVIRPGDIIGRAEGRFAGILSQYKTVSRKHCIFEFQQGVGWIVTDVSTYGTKYNNTPLERGKPQVLSNGSFLIIGDIEFFVEIRKKHELDLTERVS